MDEKIYEEFVKKDWDIDWDKQREDEKEEYKKTALNLIAKAICREDLHEIKEIIQELEDEIGEI